MKKTLYIIALFFLITSCGARKAAVQIVEEEKKIEISENTKIQTVTEAVKEEVVIEESEEIILTPIDSTKPIDIVEPGGKKTTVYNAKIERKKHKATTNTKEQVKQQQKQEKQVDVKREEKTKEKIKATEREASYGWMVWLIGITLFLLLIFMIYRKAKKKVAEKILP